MRTAKSAIWDMEHMKPVRGITTETGGKWHLSQGKKVSKGTLLKMRRN